jgi:peptidoglycan/LPS O-acetylase OafA/YrhL
MNALAAPLDRAATPDAVSHIAYRRDIDGLRAVAVIAVLVFHAFPQYLPGGFVGVDVFFVISGFLITKVILSMLYEGRFSILDFYARRVRRIFPALLLVLIACLAFGWKTLLAEDLAQLAKHVFGGASFSSNLLLWSEAGYFDKASEGKPLLHLWSLGIEEQFYFVWPLMLWTAVRSKMSISAVLWLSLAASFALNVLGVSSNPIAIFYSPLSRAWELLIGAALAHAPVARIAASASAGQRNVAAAAGIALILVVLCWLSPHDEFPGWLALLPSVGAFLLIAAGPQAWINKAFLSRRLMVGVGLISFPLYLWHWPLLTLGRSIVPDTDLGRLLLLLLSVFLAWATYRMVERPLRFGGNAPTKVFALASVMIVLACAAAIIYKRAGYPSRYPEIIQTATQFDLEGYRTGIRYRKCFLDMDQDASQFLPECVDRGTKPTVLLWGDSGAGSLYPGFRAVADRSGEFKVAQFTSSACPPLLSANYVANPTCRGKNLAVLEKVRQLKPDVVVLTAIWLNYGASAAGVADTVLELQRAGVKRVIVLGPVPAWKEAPSRTVLRLWQQDPLHRVPSPMLNFKEFGMFEHDPGRKSAIFEGALRKAAADSGATYVSAMSAMCEEDGCLMRSSGKRGNSFFLDAVHLNRAGAEYVVEAIATQLKGAELLGN